MKTNQIFLGLITLLTVTVACKKDIETVEPVRFFRPVAAAGLVADSNAILASWFKIQGATSYTVQVSRDTFRTIDVSRDVTDTNRVLIADLQWDKLYQVQVRANAPDTSLSSRWSYLGAIRTPRFPTILNTPLIGDITENAVRVTWTNSGAPVTSIRILKASDSSVVTTATLSPADVTSQFKIISGLMPSTAYIIFLYSGTNVRGWANFTTKAPFSGNLIDLTSITGSPSVLSDTLPIIASGSTVVLRRGETYVISANLNLSKTVTITSGSSLSEPAQATISMPSNFNITSGSSIDSLIFNDVTIRGTDYASKYIFNINTACNVGKLAFTNCRAEIFRGMVRLQSQPAIIGNFVVDNCIVDSLAGYGVITVDVATAKADKITIRNTTIYKAERIIVSRNNSTSVLLESITVNEAPLGGGGAYYVDYNTAASNNVTGGITINNSIFGVGKITATNQSVRGIRANAATGINTSNNFRTSDQVSLGNDIPGIVTYTRPSTQLWQDPVNGNFKIIDASFPGKSNAGDPRWRL